MEMQSSMASSGMAGMTMGTQTGASSMMPLGTAAASSSSSMHSSMGMGGISCKISMLWNWDTIDACFISSTWHITSKGMFAGSCIGVICLVCALEFLRRLSREYDRYIALKGSKGIYTPTNPASRVFNMAAGYSPDKKATSVGTTERAVGGSTSKDDNDDDSGPLSGVRQPALFRPTVPQQVIRAVLHMLQFGVAYFIMLLAMYYNGYIIICILLGAFIGAFTFSWDLGAPVTATEASGCCG